MTAREVAIIVAAAVAVYATRVVMLLLAGRVTLPEWAWTWLRYMPIAVFAALIAPAVARPGQPLDLPYLAAAAVCVLVAWRTKHVFATLVAGVAVVLVARAII